MRDRLKALITKALDDQANILLNGRSVAHVVFSKDSQTPTKTPESKGVNFKSYRWHKTVSRFMPNTNGCMSTNPLCTGQGLNPLCDVVLG
jgi:hypothetical protein